MWWNYDNFLCLQFLTFFFFYVAVFIRSARAATIKYRLSGLNSRNLFCHSSGAGCPRSSAGRVGFWWKQALSGLVPGPVLIVSSYDPFPSMWKGSDRWCPPVLKLELFMLHLLDMTTPVSYSLHSSLGLHSPDEVLLCCSLVPLTPQNLHTVVHSGCTDWHSPKWFLLFTLSFPLLFI